MNTSPVISANGWTVEPGDSVTLTSLTDNPRPVVGEVVKADHAFNDGTALVHIDWHDELGTQIHQAKDVVHTDRHDPVWM